MERKIDCVVRILDVDHYAFDEDVVAEMNKGAQSKDLNVLFDYPGIGGGAQDLFHGLIVVTVELFGAVGTAVVVEAVKYAFQVFIEKYKRKRYKRKPAVVITCGEKEIVVDYKFDLTQKQKDKLVDASVDAVMKLIEQEKAS